MAVNKIGLSVSEIEEIYNVLGNFPDLFTNNSYIEITVESNGIGKTTTVEFPTKSNNIAGKFSIEITGVDKW